MAVFILIVLVFAIANGIVKSFSLKNFFDKSAWDGKSPFVSTLETSPPSIFVFQKDPKRLAVFKLDENAYLVTVQKEGLQKTGDIFEKENGEQVARVLSLNFGTDIENFVLFSSKVTAEKQSFDNLFKTFASFVTPFKIIGGAYGSGIENTNITRIDLLKLWWQLKGVSAEKLELVELSPFKEEIIARDNKKVLGVEEESIRLKISKYLENRYLDQEKANVEIVNGSKVPGALQLAADFASSAGFSVIEAEETSQISEKTQIVAKDRNSYNASYFASIFDCDIVSEQNGQGADITVVIGRDFASNYFE